MRLRMIELMQECERVDIDKVKSYLEKINCSALIVKHDKDETRAHYHVYAKFNNANDIKHYAKGFGVEPQFIERIKSWNNAIAYAFHLTESAKAEKKYLYNEDAIVYSKNVEYNDIVKKNEELEVVVNHKKEVHEAISLYANCKKSKKDLNALLTFEDYLRFEKEIRLATQYRMERVRERDMQVLYINGLSGSGKTTLAKYFAISKGYDYFVTGSGKDILDGYDKEECIIVDDLRGDVFTKAELMKFIDNNTNSSVKSRYKNKDISMCKLMIITSVKSPNTLYNWDEDTEDSFKQLTRRLDGCYIFVPSKVEDLIEVVEFVGQGKKVTRVPLSMKIVFDCLGIIQQVGPKRVYDLFTLAKEAI